MGEYQTVYPFGNMCNLQIRGGIDDYQDILLHDLFGEQSAASVNQ